MESLVDPAPFEPYMPASVRELIAEARRGMGPAVEWLQGGKFGQLCAALALLNPHTKVQLSPEQLGWLVGIALFGDDTKVFTSDDKHVAPFALRAFAAGMRAGVSPRKRQWKTIELLVGMTSELPDELCTIVPIALTSNEALARGAALEIARKLGVCVIPTIRAARERADTTSANRLDRALAILDGGSDDAVVADDLIERVYAAYQESFDPALVPAIIALGARESQRRGPLAAKSKRELEALWHIVAAKNNPGDVDRLLGTSWPSAWRLADARFAVLRELPADPRIAAAISAFEIRYGSDASHPFRHIAALLAERHRPAKRADAPAALVAEAAAQARRAHDVDALWAQLRANPSDDRARLVLADALQSTGDPRGEYIALSMTIAAGTASVAATRRAARLLEAHIDSWTGALPGVNTSSRRFTKGFLTNVQLKAGAAGLVSSLDTPEWWSVEELHLESWGELPEQREAIARLLSTAQSLRVLVFHMWGLEHILGQLAGSFPLISALGDRSGMLEQRLAAFPSLRLFGTYVQEPELALARAAQLGLDVLLLFGIEDLRGALYAFESSSVREARFVIGNSQALPPIQPEHRGWCVRVQRGEARAELFWGSGRFEPGDLLIHLETLARAGMTEIVITLPRAGAADAENEVAAFRGASVRTDGGPLAIWTP